MTSSVSQTLLLLCTLLVLATLCVESSAKSPEELSKNELTKAQTKIFKAFDYLGNDWDAFADIFAEGATVKYCWGGQHADCTEGSVEEILRPFHNALQTFRVSTRRITGANNDRAFTTHWNNYIETPTGCGEITSGVSFWELNEEKKAVRQISLSDDGLNCIPKYYAELSSKKSE
eukprot:CAMPEP_0168775438 /NCGR_PEP_ID=MMETSP0725-20121227/5516_1 /TAXON_ID=265536 /ORGANISM="Amphiprora sp., Strain CCMP467" /LENGTH=174 /DNA_ID=CAMNT_0008825075 /DNA_START=9 /DNA_END=533 /DNA_ORIENTATION=-